MFIVYILCSKKTDRLYIGFTRNLIKRLQFHNSGLNKSTKFGIPWEIVYIEEYVHLKQAAQ